MEEVVHAPDDMRSDAVCDGSNLDLSESRK